MLILASVRQQHGAKSRAVPSRRQRFLKSGMGPGRRVSMKSMLSQTCMEASSRDLGCSTSLLDPRHSQTQQWGLLFRAG